MDPRIPALCFSLNARSSSSSSPLGAFFGAFKGLALPPIAGLTMWGKVEENVIQTCSVCSSHVGGSVVWACDAGASTGCSILFRNLQETDRPFIKARTMFRHKEHLILPQVNRAKST